MTEETSKNDNTYEAEYFKLVREILDKGKIIEGRNGRVKCLLDRSLKADIREWKMPLLTARKQFWRGIVEELLWMMRGETDTKILAEKNIHIWDGNSSKEFLEKNNLPYKEGIIGPGYGWQMRKYGQQYSYANNNSEVRYFVTGVDRGNDQLMNAVREIQKNPTSRRIIINLWNPNQNDNAALPPCHMIYQFNVLDGELYCHLYQRSWDISLGWNVQTAALLTMILAKMCGLRPGEVTHTISNIHIYEQHWESMAALYDIFNSFDSQYYELPTVEMNNELFIYDTAKFNEYIRNLSADMFILKNYQYSKNNIKMEMVA